MKAPKNPSLNPREVGAGRAGYGGGQGTGGGGGGYRAPAVGPCFMCNDLSHIWKVTTGARSWMAFPMEERAAAVTAAFAAKARGVPRTAGG